MSICSCLESNPDERSKIHLEEKIEKVEQKFEAQNAAQVTQFNTVIGSIEKFLQNFKNDLGFGSSKVLRNKSFFNFY